MIGPWQTDVNPADPAAEANPLDAIVRLLSSLSADKPPVQPSDLGYDANLISQSQALRGQMGEHGSLPLAPQGFQDAVARLAQQQGQGFPTAPRPNDPVPLGADGKPKANFLDAISSYVPNYHPGMRESPNIEDRRFNIDTMPFGGLLKALGGAAAGVDPAAWAQGGANTVAAPFKAAADIAANYRPGPENAELNKDVGKKGVEAALALTPGFARAAGGKATAELGAAGGQPPKITALVDSYRGKPEFEALADQIYNELKGMRGETVTQAAKGVNANVKPDSAEGIAIAKLQRSTDAERLGEIADHAAAWHLYSAKMGGNDFELGALGGAGRTAKLKPELTEADRVELADLLQRHKGDPEMQATIRGWFGVEDALPKAGKIELNPSRQYQEEGSFKPRAAVPESVPAAKETVRGEGSRKIDDEMLARARELRAQGVGEKTRARLISEEFSPVSRTGLEKRLRASDEGQAFSDRTYSNTSALSRPEIQDVLLKEARSGESSGMIANKIKRLMGLPAGDQSITASMVRAQLYQIRNRGGG